MFRVGLCIVTIVIGLCQARTVPNRTKQVKAYSYVLPAGAEEIRDDINHSFLCANRTDGFYVDIDNDCQIFHRCQDRARFSFICAEKTVFSQMYQTCVHEGQLGYPCEDSAMFFDSDDDDAAAATDAKPMSIDKNVDNAIDEGNETEDMPQQMVPAAMMPAQDLMPPMEDGNALEDEKVVGMVMMPVSDDYMHRFDHEQLSADLFDPVEEDDKTENTAQEVVDEQYGDDTHVNSALQDDSTQEVEVNDVSNELETAPEANELEQIATEAEQVNMEAEQSETNVQSELKNDVQIVEEQEPIVKAQENEQSHIEEHTNVEISSDDHNPELNQIDSDHVEEQITESSIQDEVITKNEQPSTDSESSNAESLQALKEENDEEQNQLDFNPSAPLADESNSTSLAQPIDEAESVHYPDWPEFIVSTVANLRKDSQPSSIEPVAVVVPQRRRKTFLFKADANSARKQRNRT
ncbi:extracellular matrix-binding protein ebh-like [Uranotaenia lowii]|uniref:extracellular matrix-binding protein ebh-like n=1 Tax=Uranotaenia lowii TaxID=190385 RepID=UPI002478CEC2|nr:extracellular matrix-binding protein ebh-like [Uranotaenia lowii]